MHFLRVKGEAYVATSLEGGGVGGGIITTHYDEKRLSVAALETVRRGSVGYVHSLSGRSALRDLHVSPEDFLPGPLNLRHLLTLLFF